MSSQHNELRVKTFVISGGVQQDIDICGELSTKFYKICGEQLEDALLTTCLMEESFRQRLIDRGWTPPQGNQDAPTD